MTNAYMDILEYHVYYEIPETNNLSARRIYKKNKAKNTPDTISVVSKEDYIVAVIPFDEKRFNNCLSIQNGGTPASIGIYLYGTSDTRTIRDSLDGDTLILKVNQKYYQCRLRGEKFRIISQSPNKQSRIRIDARKVYNFIPTDKIGDLS